MALLVVEWRIKQQEPHEESNNETRTETKQALRIDGHSLVLAGGGKQGAVPVEGHAVDGISVHLEVADQLAGGNVPNKDLHDQR